MFQKIKKMIPLDNSLRLAYHLIRAIIANLIYWFPSKKMTVVGVTWTNGKTTTTNIIARSLKKAGKKVFMFSTINYFIWEEEYENNLKMTSPDPFTLQRLLKKAKDEGCEVAIIETSSHAMTMNRVWWVDYDIAVLTNLTQDHLDLHRTMKKYVGAKLKLFKNLISYNRKPWVKKTAIINGESAYVEDFLDQTYDSLFVYGKVTDSNLKPENISSDLEWTKFKVKIPWGVLNINSPLRWMYNVYNTLAAIWVLTTLKIRPEQIEDAIEWIKTIPGRLDEVEHNENYKVFVDYAHTADALENVLETLKDIEWVNKIITVFGCTGDRDATKRPIMGQVVSKLSDVVILTQDDDYSEPTDNIIKDVMPWIDRKEWNNYWILSDRRSAIRQALFLAEENDIILIAGKWDEHIMVTNQGHIEWHDKTVVKELIKEIDDNKVIN